jgi:hypothetical protein
VISPGGVSWRVVSGWLLGLLLNCVFDFDFIAAGGVACITQ